MRVMVTGATGFLGSYLVEELVAQGHQVAILVRPRSNSWRLAAVNGRVLRIDGSLEDITALRAPLAEFQADAVVHLAWDGVGNSERNNPMQARNVVATVELAALCAELGVTTFVGAGSQAEYGPYPRVIQENDVPRPTTLYGMAKLAAGSMVRQLAAERGMRCAWLRIFSTYGPKDADIWLIPSMIKTLRVGRRMALTACEQQWGFLHARDAAMGFRLVLENPTAEGVFNLAAPDVSRLRDTVALLRDIVNPAAELGFGDIPYRPDQVMQLMADTGRLAALGWRPQTDLEAGLRETVAWYAQQS